MRRRRIRRSKRRGLTLMEIMLVLVILGILGGMATIFLRGAQKQALIKATQAEISVFKTGMEAYQMNMFSYPSSQDGLRVLLEPPNSNDGQWMGPYIEPNDLKDPWGNQYIYESNGPDEIIIKSPGPDGSVGTEDDISSQRQQ